MTPTAQALADVLLAHRTAAVALHPPGKRIITSRYVIAYGDLCAKAGVPHLTRTVGVFLQEIADWCDQHGVPPLNSLAVNGDVPGDGYDGAGGFTIVQWPNDLEACIRSDNYPANLR